MQKGIANAIYSIVVIPKQATIIHTRKNQCYEEEKDKSWGGWPMGLALSKLRTNYLSAKIPVVKKEKYA
ncbi:MAG TPA: hypothetical protein VFV68_01580 [Agriterribacter sp.]|nr:hypothetical protein [Agriterribacter sp.]